jgi:hypothetical protein
VESKFKKILLQSTVFTCLSSGVTVTMADVLPLNRETTVGDGYITHHNANFVDLADDNPVMKAIKEQQQAHRATIMADVVLMLSAVTDATVKGNLTNLQNMIAAALTADADAINDIEERHGAKSDTDTVETFKDKANLYKGAITKTDAMFGAESDIKPAFNPTENITRAEAAVMIARMHGYKDSDASSYTSSSFTDVSADNAAAPYIYYLKSKGIVNGASPTAFNPTGIVTKAAMAVMIAKAHGYTADYTSTTDVGTSPDWATPYIQYAVDKGFMDTSTDYNDNMTRADVTTMIAKADGYTDTYVPTDNLFSDVTASNSAAPYISYLADKDIIRVKRSNLSADNQHYRLAYFLMLKLKPWLDKEYKNDPIEVDELLKNHIPTYYPEWISTPILEKSLELKLQENTVATIPSVTVNLPVAKTLTGAEKIFKYDAVLRTGTEIEGATPSLLTDGKSLTVGGITEYGVYYVEIQKDPADSNSPKHKYYFSVDQTTTDQFIYGNTVEIKSIPSEGLKTLSIKPNLTLKLDGVLVDKDTYTASLDGGTTWEKLSLLSSESFLKSDQTIQFKGLSVGNYTFEVSAPETAPARFSTKSASFTVVQKIISPKATAANRTYVATDKSATATLGSFTNANLVKVNDATFDDASAGANKEVTVNVSYVDTVLLEDRKNYTLVPQSSTTANITQAAAAPPPLTGGGTPTPTGGGTTSSIEFVEIIKNTTSPYLKATGTVENIAPGTYNVSIRSTNNTTATGTIVVDDEGNFYVSLSGLTFDAVGESVTATITTAGPYKDVTVTFTTPTIGAGFSAAFDGSGTVTFTVPTAFNGITPAVTAKTGNAVTGYSGATAVSGGQFTKNYTTDTVGSFIPKGRIDMLGTNFTFAAGRVTSTRSSIPYNFTLNAYSNSDPMTASDVTIADQAGLIADGTVVTNVVLHDTVDDLDITVNSVDNFGGYAFVIHLDSGKTLENQTEISFEISGQKYSVVYGAG